MLTAKDDTIAAVSTSFGEGGIGMVRLSGKDSVAIADRIFASPKKKQPSSYDSHTVHYGHVKAPGSGETVDEVLLTVMRAPKTYTTEDVVEINCHGGIVPLKRVLELCLSEGARLAQPGEFTRRAFLNGRIDLSQAEAVLDVIRAETDAAQKIAVEQLCGGFSEAIRGLRTSIIDVLALIELAIDFPSEDVKFSPVEKITRRVDDLYRSIDEILATSEKGMVLREGASVVICGRPNVGKSSLMNALLKHDRVIVTPVAGTTRDIIEESINIAGVKVRVSDTAGIIGTHDRVELEGIKRSREKLARADIVIFMLDSSRALSAVDKEIYETIKDKKTVTVANKTDLTRKLDIDETRKEFGAGELVEASVLKKKGLDKIEDAIADKLFKGNVKIPEGPVITNMRHKKALEKAAESMERARKVTGTSYNGELLASDLNEAVYWLGLVIGESVADDVLDRIFSEFCIGK
ncbi:MAG: tRNA uridine-5-carboxymethylaminomethyl(34) synthesis GTPase MnmE [Candidatus Omnitrophota bacterium]